MFLENKYTRIYFAIMKKAQKRNSFGIIERHHIIPKSMGGTNGKENVVCLLPREHFIAHALLVKMVVTLKHKRSMAYAFVRMKQSNNKHGYSRIGNGRLYEIIKTSVVKEFTGANNPFYGDHRFTGKNNPFYGKTHTTETRRFISDVNKIRMKGMCNPFYNKTHSRSTKEIISNVQSKPVKIKFYDGTVVEFKKRIDIGKYLGISTSLGIQLCTIKKHLWSKYEIREMIQS